MPYFLESFELVEITLDNFIVAPFSIFIGFFVSDYILNKFFNKSVGKVLLRSFLATKGYLADTVDTTIT